MKAWIQGLFRPSPHRSIIALLATGAVLGAIGLAVFDFSLHATSTETFCISCHEMEANPYAQLQKTSHYNNAAGVRPTCSDCHVPKEFVPKMIRKVEAAREVWGTITGKINTPEKYIAHTPVMKAREIARIKANDSQECRNCHEPERMLLGAQSTKAREYHQAMPGNGKTCIDCHAGIAHPKNAGAASAHGF
jgi:cytochrome c-type protein NapC